MDAIKNNVDDKDTAKLMNNMLSGMLGKTKQKHAKIRINSDIDSIWNYMKKQGALKRDIFVTPLTL